MVEQDRQTTFQLQTEPRCQRPFRAVHFLFMIGAVCLPPGLSSPTLRFLKIALSVVLKISSFVTLEISQLKEKLLKFQCG
jgi:hypothetical protein